MIISNYINYIKSILNLNYHWVIISFLSSLSERLRGSLLSLPLHLLCPPPFFLFYALQPEHVTHCFSGSAETILLSATTCFFAPFCFNLFQHKVKAKIFLCFAPCHTRGNYEPPSRIDLDSGKCIISHSHCIVKHSFTSSLISYCTELLFNGPIDVSWCEDHSQWFHWTFSSSASLQLRVDLKHGLDNVKIVGWRCLFLSFFFWTTGNSIWWESWSQGVGWLGPNLFDPKLTRLAYLLSFASFLFSWTDCLFVWLFFVTALARKYGIF